MTNKEYIEIIKLALCDGNITLCLKVINEILRQINNLESIRLISFLEWHNNKAEHEKNNANLLEELEKAVSYISKFIEIEFHQVINNNIDNIKDYIGLKNLEICSDIVIDNKFVDFEQMTESFYNDWLGKIKMGFVGSGVNGKFMKLLEPGKEATVVEVFLEINFEQRIVIFKTWRDDNEVYQFLGTLRDWFERETQDKGALKIFLSYSHIDEKWKNALITSLGILKRRKLIKIWHDRAIRAGDKWGAEIEEALLQSHIAILLVSPEFVDSEYCYDIETEKAIELYRKGQCRVIPIFVRETLDLGAKYLEFQGFPLDKKPLKSFGKAESDNKGIQQVANAIGIIVEEMHKTGKIV